MEPKLETVELDGSTSLRTLHYECSAFQTNHDWHFHPECELSYVIHGTGTRFIGDSVDHFNPGDLVFIGPNIPHCWVSDEEESQNEMTVLQFSPTCLGEEFLNTPEASQLKALLTQAKRGLHYKGGTSQIKSRLDQIENSSGLERIAHFIRLLDLLSSVEDKVLLTSELYFADNSEFHSGRLGKVMSYVKANLSADIKQTDVADVVCMTPQSFSRFFKATTGKTFVSFVNVMRITKACRLLANSKEDIIDIAFECGYSNLSNFNRRFSEIKKTTPSEYRKQHQFVN